MNDIVVGLTLRANGKGRAARPGHADLRDSSELLAVYPNGVRMGKIAAANSLGVMGTAAGASASLGGKLLALKIQSALAQIKRWRRKHY